MRVRRFLHILLVTGVIALLWQLRATWYHPLPGLSATAPNDPATEPPLPFVPVPEASTQLTDLIADKDLFSPGRSRPVPEPSEQPTEPSVPPPAHLKLVGVFLAPTQEEALFVDSSQGGKVVRVRKGEALGAYQLVQVTPLQVTLTVGQDGDEVQLPLALLDSGTASKAPRLMPPVQRPGAAKPGQAVQNQAGRKPGAASPGEPNEAGIRQDILGLQRRLRQIRPTATRGHTADEGEGNGDEEGDEE